MNKKILVYYSQLNLGGAERSLVRFMNLLVQDGNEVTLFTRYGGGSSEYMLDSRIRRFALNRHVANNHLELVACAFERFVSCFRLLTSKDKYDLVIVGLQGLDPGLVLRTIKADHYCQCIRTDLKQLKARERVLKTLKRYECRIDSYMCVSKTARDSLLDFLPEMRDRTFVLYNILNTSQMRALAATAENPFSQDGCFHIASICRISDSAKGVFRILNVVERLAKDGRTFRWYLVGDGPDLASLRHETERRGMQDYLILPGATDNPFGYYRYADLVAVPSYHEGLCGVVNEAKITGAAVLATEFSGIHEQLTHGVNGWIVENDEEAIHQGIRHLVENPEDLRRIRNTVFPEEIVNDEEKLSKLYATMEWS